MESIQTAKSFITMAHALTTLNIKLGKMGPQFCFSKSDRKQKKHIHTDQKLRLTFSLPWNLENLTPC